MTVSELPFVETVRRRGEQIRRGSLTTLQINVGKRCNQACHHCHVGAGPSRTEDMEPRTAERIVSLLEAPGGETIHTVDITGGAPELNGSFRFLVREAHRLGKKVIDRCNLTVLLLEGQEDTLDFLAGHRVEVVASLPCYTSDNVDRQRGRGVFAESLEALRRLNAAGYGQEGSGLVLNLVYNPGGPSLPPSQAALEAEYKSHLEREFGVIFNRLLTLTNMPISRFRQDLERRGGLERYMGLLRDAFNPGTLGELMCRSLVSVGWDGRLYDCDFNQMLDLPVPAQGPTLWDIDSFAEVETLPIALGEHCFGCTAGAGSSCGGTLA